MSCELRVGILPYMQFESLWWFACEIKRGLAATKTVNTCRTARLLDDVRRRVFAMDLGLGYHPRRMLL